MNLVIDIGNTRVKAALFQNSGLFELKIFHSVSELLSDDNFINQAKNAIIGSVVDDLESFYSSLNTKVPTLIFNSQTITPLKNLYSSAATLGSDRFAASVGAQTLYPNSNVLAIDAGTCIKYNFTNSKNEYLGGGISPGIEMKLKALQHFTSKLPLINFDRSYTELIGENTENSILSGVLNGSVAEIDKIITNYNNLFKIKQFMRYFKFI